MDGVAIGAGALFVGFGSRETGIRLLWLGCDPGCLTCLDLIHLASDAHIDIRKKNNRSSYQEERKERKTTLRGHSRTVFVVARDPRRERVSAAAAMEFRQRIDQAAIPAFR